MYKNKTDENKINGETYYSTDIIQFTTLILDRTYITPINFLDYTNNHFPDNYTIKGDGAIFNPGGNNQGPLGDRISEIEYETKCIRVDDTKGDAWSNTPDPNYPNKTRCEIDTNVETIDCWGTFDPICQSLRNINCVLNDLSLQNPLNCNDWLSKQNCQETLDIYNCIISLRQSPECYVAFNNDNNIYEGQNHINNVELNLSASLVIFDCNC